MFFLFRLLPALPVYTGLDHSGGIFMGSADVVMVLDVIEVQKHL